MSLVSWKLEKGLCRCCHAEGLFKSLSEPSFNLGQTEIFSEMLQQCLDIVMHPVQGEYSVATYTICDACIHRLRDATNFKQQVLKCEERFRDMYSNVKSFHEVEVPVKMEESSSLCDFKEDLKEDHSDTDFGVQDEEEGDKAALQLLLEEEEDDDKTVLQLLLEGKKEKLKGKAKAKPKPKPKPKPKAKKAEPKRSARPQKPKPKPKEDKAEDQTAPKKDYDLLFTRTIGADGTKNFVCSACGKSFTRRGNFTQHYSHVHLKKRPKLRSCHMCKEKYKPNERAAHMESAHGQPAPQCNICLKKFTHPSRVLMHLRVWHNGEKPYPCTVCDMKFSTSSKLSHHFKRHISLKPYKCDYCDKAFKRRKTLIYHIRMHLDIRNYACSVCPKKFVQHSSMRYHIKKHHPELL